MADDLMYFGTSEYMTWIKCPNSGMGRNRVGWSATGTYLNGGGWTRSSGTKHFEPTLNWSFLNHEQVRLVEDFYNGSYGHGPFYFYDAFAMRTNILPPYWSIPRTAQDDSPPLIVGKRPTLTDTITNTLNLPTKSAVYDLDTPGGDVSREIYLPIPPGYSLHLGVLGTATGTATFKVEFESGSNTFVPLSPSGSTVLNHVVSGSAWAILSVVGDGMLTLAGIMAVLLPDFETPTLSKFYSGAGHSGCDFKTPPNVVGYSSPQAIDYQSVTAEFVEVGAWLQQ